MFNLNDSSGQTHNALFDSADLRDLTMVMFKSLTFGRYKDMTWYVNVFLRSISSSFYKQLLRQYFCAKKLQSQTMTREKLRKAHLYKKVMCKMLMALTPGVDFINVLRTAFTLVDPKSVK